MPKDPNEEQPIAVAVVGTGDGRAPMLAGATAVTPPHLPNLAILVVSPLLAIVIRFVNSYLTVLVGLVAAGMTSNVIPYTDFLDLVKQCAGLSIAGAGVGLLKDVLTIFTRLESKFPLATGNV